MQQLQALIETAGTHSQFLHIMWQRHHWCPCRAYNHPEGCRAFIAASEAVANRRARMPATNDRRLAKMRGG